MKNKWHFSDWFVVGAITCGWVIGTVYLFLFHSDANFGIWATFAATIISGYHWLCIHDDKRPDCGEHDGNS